VDTATASSRNRQQSEGSVRPPCLALTFSPDVSGRTFLSRQFARYPFHVCKVLYEDPELEGMGTLYLQSCAGGLYENDDHVIEIAAVRGAKAHVTTQASTIVHSMTAGEARQRTMILAEADSYIEALPDPQILFPNARFAGCTRIRIASGAAAILSESFLTHDPAGQGGIPHSYSSEIIVEDEARRPLVIDRLHMDESTFGNLAPGVMGTFLACGTMLVLAPGRSAPLASEPASWIAEAEDGMLIGRSALPQGAGLLYRILAADGARLKRAMARCWAGSRLALFSHAPRERRK
jgi:urease accessory protein